MIKINIKKVLINPIFLFFVVWSFVFILFSLQLSNIFLPLRKDFLLFVGFIGIIAVLGYILGYYYSSKNQSIIRTEIKPLYLGFIKFLFGLVCIILFIEVVVFRGVPLIWLLLDIPKTYFDYGIPTIHGFFNAILIFLGTICFWVIIARYPSKIVWFIFLSCIVIPILLISRQVLNSLLIQCFFIFIGVSHKKDRLKKRYILILILLAITFFSFLGLIRTNSDHLRGISDIKNEYEWIPTIILWPYMYLTTPLNNFINQTNYSFEKTQGYSSVSKFTPTIIRQPLQQIIWKDIDIDTPAHVVSNFNVSTYASVLYFDFGWYGVLLFTFFIIFISSKIFHRFNKYKSLYDLLLLVIFNQMIVLSFFDNLFLLWGVSFQIILAFIFKKYLIKVTAIKTQKYKIYLKITSNYKILLQV